MTDKQSFLERLNDALLSRGVSELDIRPYLERFDRFYDRMANDPNRVNSEMLNDVDALADNIAAQISERYDEINRFAERTMTLGTIAPEPDASDEYELVEDAPTGMLPINETEVAADGGSEVSDEAASRLPDYPSDETASRLPDYVETESVPGNAMFWVLFAASIPVTAPLALLALSVFAAAWIGLFALIIGIVAGIVVLAAAGSAASLVGIIYGVVQMFNVPAVGLYEIGLGVIIAGSVLFVDILLYNVAVRLLPLLVRLVGRLFGYVIKRLAVLFNYLKKESAKL